MQSRRGAQSTAPYGGYGSGYGSGPFSIMRRLSDEMDRLFENFGFGRPFSPSQQGGGWDVGEYGENLPSMWSPHIEVCERDGKLHIEADLPGMKRDDIQVRVEQDQVIIQGERRHEQKQERRGYYRSERSYGSFYRTIPLPEGTNAESATATFRDGVLEIDLDMPRQQERGRTLEIREGGSSSSGGYAGTGSGATYGSGTTGAMQGASSGGGTTLHGTSSGQHTAPGTSGSQQAASGSGATSGSGTMHSGSGNPSVGAGGMGSGASSGSSGTSGTRGTKGSST